MSRLLMVALLVGFAARFAAWALLHTELDIAIHHEHPHIAAHLARGEGFLFNFFGTPDRPLPTSQQAPFVPFFLAACYLIGGIHTAWSLSLAIFIQIFASMATVYWAYQWADNRIGRSTGLVVAWMVACYPPLIVSPLHIQALVWNIFWLALSLKASQHRHLLSIVMASLGAVHTDPINAVWVGPLLWLAAQNGRAICWRRLMVLSVAVLMGLMPWTIRNYQVHGRLMFIKNTLPYVLWQGNNPESSGTDKLIVDENTQKIVGRLGRIDSIHQDVVTIRKRDIGINEVLEPDFIHHLAGLPTEIARMDAFGQRIKQELWNNPGHYVVLCVQRLYFWVWFDLTNLRSYSPIYRVGYLILIGLACWELARNRQQWSLYTPLFVAAIGLTFVHVFIIGSARFRIPLEFLLIFPSSCGLNSLRITFVGMLPRLLHYSSERLRKPNPTQPLRPKD